MKIGSYLVMTGPLVDISSDGVDQSEVVECAWPQLPSEEAYLSVEPLGDLLQPLDACCDDRVRLCDIF